MSLDIEINSYDTILKALFGKKVKRLVGNLSVQVGDIISYHNGNDVEFYKIKKSGAISRPDDRYCDRILLGEGNKQMPLPTAAASTAGIITENRVKQLASSQIPAAPEVPNEASLDEIWKGVCNS